MKKKILCTALIVALIFSCFAVFTSCNKKTKDLLPNLTILYEKDNDLKNTYTMIAVDEQAPFVDINEQPKAGIDLNTEGADALINWMSLESTRKLIASYGVKEYGEKLFYLQEDAPIVKKDIPKATDKTKIIKMSTTTSVNDSGLMQYIMPEFEKEYGYKVEIASAGTGAAIKAATMGNADMILVHSKSQEETFVNGGFGRIVADFEKERISFMYNYFVLVGPKKDSAKVANSAGIKEAFALIAQGKYAFISRGDSSGTHTKEISLWNTELGIVKDVEKLPQTITTWYISAGQGMGACLTMANEKSAYILTDKATYLTYKNFVEKE